MKLCWFLSALLLLIVAEPDRASEPMQPAKKELPTYQVPYKLSDSQHIVVRAKINGKGPFNFIVDTGAPLLYVSVPVAKKLGIKEEKKLTVLDRFEIEGGAKHEKIKALVETPFQLEGMNAMGLPGVELHGIMGYTLLAHYKMEIDFTKDRMAWTRLEFAPPQPQPLGTKDKDVESLNSLGPLMKAMALLLGKKTIPPPAPRGFLGLTLDECKGSVTITAVLENSPAAGKVKAGDKLLTIQGKEVTKIEEVQRHTARLTAGETVRLIVLRDGEEKNREVALTAGEGL